jgi:hypothetical protein
MIVAGHDSAVATAEQINKTETYRDPDSFADIVRLAAPLAKNSQKNVRRR